MNKTRISLALHDVINGKGQQYATGVIVGGDPSVMVPIHGWVTYTPIDPPSRGRKKNLQRKAAVILAYQWFQGWDGRGKAKTDCLLAALLGYSDERAVRRVRMEAKIAIKGRYIFIVRSIGKAGGCAILLEDISRLSVESHGMQIIGPGWIWHYGEREAVYQRQWKMEPNITSDDAEKALLMIQQAIDQSRQAEGG